MVDVGIDMTSISEFSSDFCNDICLFRCVDIKEIFPILKKLRGSMEEGDFYWKYFVHEVEIYDDSKGISWHLDRNGRSKKDYHKEFEQNFIDRWQRKRKEN